VGSADERKILEKSTHLSTELSPSWEAATRLVTQEFSKILSNPVVLYCAHRSPPQVPILSQMNPVRITPSYFSKVHIFLISALVGGEWSASHPGRFTPSKEFQISLNRRLGGPQSRFGRYGEVKIVDPTGTRTPTPRSSSL
jgi:hypothetical protein